MIFSGIEGRRLRNVIAVAASFLLAAGTAYALEFAVSRVAGQSPSGGLSAIPALAAPAVGILLLTLVYSPPQDRSEAAPEGAAPRVPGKERPRAYLIPASLFLLIVSDVILSFFGLGSTGAEAAPGEFSVLSVVLGCLFFPILEETFFRGAMLTALKEEGDPLLSRIAAVVAQAAAFSLFHRGGSFIFPLVAGMILALPAKRGRRTVIPAGSVVVHAIYNLSVYAAAWLSEASVSPETTLSVVAGSAAVTAGVMILVSVRRVKK